MTSTSTPRDGSTTPRRLTRDQQREQTRTELLDAAVHVFAAKGFHAASVDDIASAAGYTKGAVYSNFTSKEELFLAVFDRQAEGDMSTVDRIFDDVAPEQRLAALGEQRTSFGFFSPEWQLLEAEFTLYAARHEHLRERLVERQRALREQLAARVERQLADLGLMTDHDLHDVARLIGAAVDGLAMQQLAEGEGAPDMGRLFSLLLEVLVRGGTRPA